jgi:AcrR family transcriptional regulator
MSPNDAGLALSPPKVDGRRQRSECTRQALIEAFLKLLRRTPAMPQASRIAEEAGCSIRSIFECFTDLDGLVLAATDYAIAQAQGEAVAHNVGAYRTIRIHSQVEALAFVCEKWMPLWRLIMRQEQPRFREHAALVSSAVVERLKLIYGPELSALADSERDRLLLALAALISFESWDQLRHTDGLSITAAQTVWRSAIDRLLPRNDVLLGTVG